jgi:hypothetical protein
MVIIGYGDYQNYKLQQVPDAFLVELGNRYQLRHDAQTGSEYAELQLTIAVHEEIQRRQKGGAAQPKEPSAKELAIKVVTKGFQILSKDHHPDRKGGTNTAQRKLNEVRTQLLRACDEINDEYIDDDALVILEPPRPRANVTTPISDEDIPF